MFKIFKAKVPSKEYTVRSKYPFPQMKPGSAFTVPADHPAAQRKGNRGCNIASAAYGHASRHGGKFVIRRNTDDSITVYCVE
jgi:hypothetical protein